MQVDLDDSRECCCIADYTTAEEEKDLGLIVNEAIRGWVFKHNLIDRAWVTKLLQ